MKNGRAVRQDAVCHLLCSTGTVSVLPRELWMGLETAKLGANYSDCEMCRWPCVNG